MTPLSDEIKQQTLAAYKAAGGIKSKAALMLGIPQTTFKNRYRLALLDKSVSNLEPLIPDGQKLKGVSTLYDKNGDSVMQWVKTNSDLDRQLEMLNEAIEELKKEIPREKPIEFNNRTNKGLLSQYTLTDYHLGQMSLKEESGEEWNTQKSADFIIKWFEAAIECAPDADDAILCQLGDFLHFDSIDPVTPTSKHLMDTDTRYANIVRVAIRVLKQIISMLLHKHKTVHVLMAEGNHDISSSIWLRAIFKEVFIDEPRVVIIDEILPYYVYEHGKTALFYHHGHKRGIGDLSRIFAGMFREIFGRTKYAYAHMGHNHHIASKEDALMVIEQHPTLAPKDAYSARGGYLSNRGASVITYSKEYGEVSRVTIRPEMVTR